MWVIEFVIIPLLVSLLAAAILGVSWRIWIGSYVARNYCGTWIAHKFVAGQLVPMENNPVACIHSTRRMMHPEILELHASHDERDSHGQLKLDRHGNVVRVKLQGEIVVNPVSYNQAVVTIRRLDNGEEYAAQQYFRMNNGDIFVVPTEGEYGKHVLRRTSSQSEHAREP